MKKIDLSIEILKMAKNPSKHKDFLTLSEKYDISKQTINRRVIKLKELGYLHYDDDLRLYSVNPYVKDITGNISEQIKLGKIENEGILKLGREMWDIFYKHVVVYYNFEKQELNDQVVFSDYKYNEMAILVYSLIFQLFIANRGLIYLLKNSEDFNFDFIIRSTLGKDPSFIKVIKELNKTDKPKLSYEEYYKISLAEHILRKNKN